MNVYILKSKTLGSLFKVTPLIEAGPGEAGRLLTGYILTTGSAPTTFDSEAEANQWKGFILPKMYEDLGELEVAKEDIIPEPYELVEK